MVQDRISSFCPLRDYGMNPLRMNSLEKHIVILKNFLKYFLNLFLGQREGREKERETSMCGCLLCAPTGDLPCNPGMCPDWESNLQPSVVLSF